MTRGISLFVAILFALKLSGQVINISPDPTLIPPIDPGQCMIIEPGTSLTFERNPDCDANLLITDGNGAVTFLDTSASSAPFTFNDPGEYAVFCGGGTGTIAIQAVCVIVQTDVSIQTIPTVKEWGLIILFLLLGLFSAVAMMNNYSTAAKKTTPE